MLGFDTHNSVFWSIERVKHRYCQICLEFFDTWLDAIACRFWHRESIWLFHGVVMDLYFAVIDFKKTRQVNLWKIIPKLPNYSSWSVLALPGMSQHVVMDVLSKEHSGGTATATFAWNFSKMAAAGPGEACFATRWRWRGFRFVGGSGQGLGFG